MNEGSEEVVDWDSLRIPWQLDHTFKFVRANGSFKTGPGRCAEEAAQRLGITLRSESNSPEDFFLAVDLGLACTNSVAVGPVKRWFAWRPVVLDHGNGERVCGRWLYRRLHQYPGDQGTYWAYSLTRNP